MSELQAEVEARTGRSFADVQRAIEQHLDMSWDDAEVIIETRSSKGHGSPADVIVYLWERTQIRKPTMAKSARKAVVRWIGKPWRERENPWEKYKNRIPEHREPSDDERWNELKTPPTDGGGEEWKP